MDIDTKSEIDRLTSELNDLQSQFNKLEAQRQALINQMLNTQGVINYLNNLNGKGK